MHAIQVAPAVDCNAEVQSVLESCAPRWHLRNVRRALLDVNPASVETSIVQSEMVDRHREAGSEKTS